MKTNEMNSAHIIGIKMKIKLCKYVIATECMKMSL